MTGAPVGVTDLHVRGVLLVSIGWVLAGCITGRGRADAAFERGDYVAAADGYGELFEREPGDAALRTRRDEARRRALDLLTTRVHWLRTAGRPEPALTALASLLSRHHAWPELEDAAMAHMISDEVAAADGYLRGEVQRLVADHRPLTAEQAIAARRTQLAFSEFDPVWPVLEQVAHDGGDAICRAAVPADIDQSPYLARLAAAYCAHFHVEARAPERLPHGVASVTVEGAISGMTDAQRARLEAALARLMQGTVWFNAGAEDARGRIALAGDQAVAFGANQVERTAQWWESVSHLEQEMYQEPYQEMYQESYQESYTVQVPYTEFHTESYSCGFGTTTTMCSRMVSSTNYRSETRYRTAWRTAFRTAYRTAWRTVTKWTREPRYYRFHAVERVGNYSGAWNLAIDLGGDVPPLQVRVANRDRQVGYDQDAEFAAANVAPSRAHLRSFDDWFTQLLDQMAHTLRARLAEHWSTAYCQVPSFSAETAARCAYGAAPPPTARAALARLFGNEVDPVIARFAPADSR